MQQDVGQPLRAAYFSVLNGQLTYEASVIPIVDEKLDVDITEHDIYVLMLDQIEDDTNANKSNWATEVLLRMQVVNQRKSTNTKEVVEDISNQILTILFPTRTTTSLSLTAPLSLTYAKKVSANYNPLIQNDRGFLISKVLEFKNRITQQ